jgi:hypothetical protein
VAGWHRLDVVMQLVMSGNLTAGFGAKITAIAAVTASATIDIDNKDTKLILL